MVIGSPPSQDLSNPQEEQEELVNPNSLNMTELMEMSKKTKVNLENTSICITVNRMKVLVERPHDE